MAELRDYTEIVRRGSAKALREDNSIEKRLLYGAIGLAGETGEVVEMIKKYVYHGKPFEQDRLAEELGDVLWHVGLLAGTIDRTIRGLALQNVVKLKARYPERYPDPIDEVVIGL